LNAQNKLTLANSYLSNTDIGIFAGRRDATSHGIAYSGGIIDCDADTFSSN